MPFAEYLSAAVLVPFGLSGELQRSPAWGFFGSLLDLLALGSEFLEPTLVPDETLEEATAVVFPGLVGVLPGFGRRIRTTGASASSCATRSPRTGPARATRRRRSATSAPAGRSSGSTPRPGSRSAFLTDKDFDDWSAEAKEAWPALSDAVLAEAAR